MTRIEKIKLAINRGFTYDFLTGKIFSRFGKEITSKNYGYIKICLLDENKKNHTLRGHQFAWFIVYNEVVKCIDHENKNKTDNRIINLRSLTKRQNAYNTNAKGYYFNKRANKFHAQIVVNSKSIYLGLFDSEIDAADAYQTAKKIYHIIPT